MPAILHNSAHNWGTFHSMVVPNLATSPKMLFINGDKCQGQWNEELVLLTYCDCNLRSCDCHVIPVGTTRYQSTVFMECDRSADKEKGKLVLQEVSYCEKICTFRFSSGLTGDAGPVSGMSEVFLLVHTLCLPIGGGQLYLDHWYGALRLHPPALRERTLEGRGKEVGVAWVCHVTVAWYPFVHLPAVAKSTL